MSRRNRAPDSGTGTNAPHPGAEPAAGAAGSAGVDAESAAVPERVMARARLYGMRTEATDWNKVGQFAGRSQKATAALARSVDDQPLRAIPPVRE